MRHFIFAWFFVLPVSAAAESLDWQVLEGSEIGAVLSGQTLDYPRGWQDFRVTGRTLYNTGRDSWGYWVVRGDQYCSMWPPSDLWACYDMARKGDVVRFIGAGGDTTDGTLRAEGE